MLPQRALPLSTVLSLQISVTAGAVVAMSLDKPGWYGAATGLGVASLLALRIRGSTITGLVFARLGFWYELFRRRRQMLRFEPFDAQLSDGSPIGFHWDGRLLMSLVGIGADPQVMTVMEPAVTVSGQTMSVRALAECLRQFDITVDSIDVIIQGARFHDRGQLGAVYDAVLGPLPATAQRSVWVVVRIDPALCPDAVRHRGGGWDGIVRTAVTATRRVANRLSDAGLRPRIATAAEIASATAELAHGTADLSTLDETWTTCRKDRLEFRSFTVGPSMFSTAGLHLPWTVPSQSTTVCISLRRDDRDDLIKLRGLVRFDNYGRTRVQLRNLGQLHGRQYDALACSLPLPAPRRAVPGWLFGKSIAAVDDLELPAGGCGQVIGADNHGRAVALSLFGPLVNRVEMCGTLHLAQQVVLRSLALGAWVNVHTRRPAAWRTMVEQIGNPNILTVNDPAADVTRLSSHQNRRVEMFDGASEDRVADGVTTMVVKPPHAEPSSHADVTLQLLDHDQDLVRVATRSAAVVVRMVATDDELRYIKSSLDIVD
ncbi:type VII secretion protein EccE [Mycobacterium sp. 1100029.7]|nr:type VII secretion protein EccE [Mycobacterium sp. 1100029.7]